MKGTKYNKDGNLLSEITDVVVAFGLQLGWVMSLAGIVEL